MSKDTFTKLSKASFETITRGTPGAASKFSGDCELVTNKTLADINRENAARYSTDRKDRRNG